MVVLLLMLLQVLLLVVVAVWWRRGGGNIAIKLTISYIYFLSLKWNINFVNTYVTPVC